MKACLTLIKPIKFASKVSKVATSRLVPRSEFSLLSVPKALGSLRSRLNRLVDKEPSAAARHLGLLNEISFPSLRNRLLPESSIFDNDGFSLLTDSMLRGNSLVSMDFKENPDSYLLLADMPGMKKEDINIGLKDNVLEISSVRKSEKRSEEDDFLHQERHYGRFYRALTLPENIDENNIKSFLENGVLHIEIPKVKSEDAAPDSKVIEITER